MVILNQHTMKGFSVLVAVVLIGLAKGAWKSNDKVLLQDVNVLTLHNGKMTTGKRSAPVKQLQCVGGSAGCHSYVPQVVQCYNRGSDGIDVQWECKADMDNAYRFGQVEVICEGYDYPDDPYILKGSCGLEYTLELTKEGYEKQNGGHQQSYHRDDSYDSGSGYATNQYKKSSWFGDTIMLVIVGVIIYAIYTTCIAGPDQNTSDWQDSNGPHPRSGPRSGPPPPGFRDEYMPGHDDGNCHSTGSSGYTHTRTNTGTNTGTGGGFWTGAATGGLLGYLFGSRTNTYNQPYNRGGWRSGWGSGYGSGWGSSGYGSGWGSSGWGSSGWGSSTRTAFRSGGGGGSSFGSSGTRTASGFGGTRRR